MFFDEEMIIVAPSKRKEKETPPELDFERVDLLKASEIRVKYEEELKRFVESIVDRYTEKKGLEGHGEGDYVDRKSSKEGDNILKPPSKFEKTQSVFFEENGEQDVRLEENGFSEEDATDEETETSLELAWDEFVNSNGGTNVVEDSQTSDDSDKEQREIQESQKENNFGTLGKDAKNGATSSHKKRPKKSTREEDNEKKWLEWYNRLLKFKNRYGHFKVPQLDSKYTKLYGWIKRQNRIKREGKLPEHRSAMLEQIGFTWNLKKRTRTTQESDESWVNNFAKVKQFKDLQGHLDVEVNKQHFMPKFP
jgi:hypothetical protein